MRAIIFLIFVLIADYALSCPGCAGSMSNPKETRLVYILMGFIGLIYIPFFILYRTVFKHRKLNQITEASVENGKE